MGNRILKESICMSNEIDALSWFEEVFFYRLIVTVDDYGVFPAETVALGHLLFPRKETLSRRMVEECLKHLEEIGLIERYRVPGKGVFLKVMSWEKHQRLRTSKRKYPGREEAEPDEEDEVSGETEDTGDTDHYQETEHSAETETSAEADPPVISLPLNDGSEYGITQKDMEEYTSLYPAVDILQELRSMRGWCLGNEKKRKTRSGVKRFINSWMARAQDRGGTSRGSPGTVPDRNGSGFPGNPYRQENPYRMMIGKGEVS